jgi:hypothetical protein
LVVLDTTAESGESIRLVIEAAGPSGLRPIGVTVDSIAVGDHVTAVVSPSRRRPKENVYGHEIIKADGNVVPLNRTSDYANSRPADGAASTIFGTWSPPWSAFMGLVRARSAWRFTDAGQAAFDGYSPAQSSQAECISVGAPWLMVHPVVQQIEDAGEYIVLRTDWLGGVERRIYLDNRPHPTDAERFQQGHSTGHWEKGELVVDTTNFTERIYAGIASSKEKHLVERFAVAEDGKSLTYSFVLEDPVYLAESVTGTFQWDFRPDLEASKIACDLEIAKRYIGEIR